MASQQSCADQWYSELTRFEYTVLLSLTFTVALGVFRVCGTTYIHRNLYKTFVIMAFASAIKLMLAILLFTVLNPTCPIGCQCGDYHQSYLYPSMVLLMGFYWAYVAHQYRKASQVGVEDAPVVNELPQTGEGETASVV